MAETLSRQIIDDKNIFIGRQILDVITFGMYDNPLIVYREYIQNAVDSIDKTVEQVGKTNEDFEIKIKLNGFERSISIQDNGQGVSNDDIQSLLLSIGASNKEGTEQRGFRGIGRLGGLGYCNKLRFETRSNSNENVAIVEWDRSIFEELNTTASQISLEETINRVASINFRAAETGEPSSFFKVTMVGVERFHRDEILNLKNVKDYLSQVAPVPYDQESFSFASDIDKYMEDRLNIKTYNIYLNGEQIKRPYSDLIANSKGVIDKISGVEFFDFKGVDGNFICHGWYAKTNYQASIPPSVKMRGIRVRQGNIEVGNENSLADCFIETRFAVWHIGEIFIVGNSLKPNARRDWFENTPNFEKFLEQFTVRAKQLSSFCRDSSKNRGLLTRINNRMDRICENFAEEIHFIDENHYFVFVESALKDLDYFIDKYSHLIDEERMATIIAIRDKIKKGVIKPKYLSECIDGRKLRSGKKEILLGLILGVKESYGKTSCVDTLLSTVLTSFIKEGCTKEVKIANI